MSLLILMPCTRVQGLANATASAAPETFSIPTFLSHVQIRPGGSLQIKNTVSFLFNGETNTHSDDVALGAITLVFPIPKGAWLEQILVQEKNNDTPVGAEPVFIDADYRHKASGERLELTLNPKQSAKLMTYSIAYQLINAIEYGKTNDSLELNIPPLNYHGEIGLISVTVESLQPSSAPLKDSDVSHEIASSNPRVYNNFEQGKFLYVGKDVSRQAGFAISLSLPKGYLKTPLSKRPLLQQNIKMTLVFYPLLVIALLLLLWWRKERVYNTRVRIIKLPVPGMLAFLAEEKIGGRALASTIFALAQNGYLKIISQIGSGIFSNRQSYYLVSLKKPTPELKPHEHLLLHAIFSSGTRVRFTDLEERTYQVWPEFKRLLYKEALANNYFDNKPWNNRLVSIINCSAFLFPPLIAIIASLSTASLGNLVFLSWFAFISSLILIIVFGLLAPTKTSHGIATYRKAIEACIVKANKNWIGAIPELGALGLLRSLQSIMKDKTIKSPAWFQSKGLTMTRDGFYLHLQEIQQLIESAAPTYVYRKKQRIFSPTRSAA